MGAINAVKILNTELSGDYRIVIMSATPTTADDVMTMGQAAYGYTSVGAVLGANLKTGSASTLQFVQPTVATDGSTVTIVTLGEDGGAATTWAAINLVVLAK